ncbi:DMT family transporter [Silvibacterium acidisoli]|uniref:DMT family transporter n=1 Tax=Acidobacteriaceae bacterium ZG23-2 TaxID=2883246 RepID=UPI00406CDFEB
MSRSLKAHILLIAVVLVWGTTFVLVKAALQDISPMLFNLLRMAIAAGTLAIFYRRHLKRISRRSLLCGAITGVFLALGYEFQTAGLRLTTPSKSAFITGLTVVLVPLLLILPGLRPSGGHAPRWNAYLGAFIAFIGIVLLTTPAQASFGFASINRGDLLTFACSIAFSFHILCLAHFSPKMHFQQLAVVQMSAATVFIAIGLPLFGHPMLHWTPAVVFGLMMTGLLATAVAFTVQSWAQQFLPATHTALIFTLEPVFAWITSFLLLGERLSGRSTAGALLILGGIACTELIPSVIQPTAHEGAPLVSNSE